MIEHLILRLGLSYFPRRLKIALSWDCLIAGLPSAGPMFKPKLGIEIANVQAQTWNRNSFPCNVEALKTHRNHQRVALRPRTPRVENVGRPLGVVR